MSGCLIGLPIRPQHEERIVERKRGRNMVKLRQLWEVGLYRMMVDGDLTPNMQPTSILAIYEPYDEPRLISECEV